MNTNPIFIPGYLFHDGIGIWVDEAGYPAEPPTTQETKKMYYPKFRPTPTGYAFKIYNSDGEEVFDSISYPTMSKAREIARDMVKEYERQSS